MFLRDRKIKRPHVNNFRLFKSSKNSLSRRCAAKFAYPRDLFEPNNNNNIQKRVWRNIPIIFGNNCWIIIVGEIIARNGDIEILGHSLRIITPCRLKNNVGIVTNFYRRYCCKNVQQLI